jgi:ABC-2 type transport system permease protein
MTAARRSGVRLQVRIMSERLLDDLLAVPGTFVATLILSVGFLVVLNGSLGESAIAPAGTHGGYLGVAVPAALLIATVGSANCGYLIALDREDGYVDRLFVMPVSRSAIVWAPILVCAGSAALRGTLVLAAAAVLGATPAAGFPGLVAMLALATLWGTAMATCVVIVALLSTVDFVRIADLALFSLMFVSPILVSRAELHGWFRVATDANPTTYVLEGMRTVMMHGWDFATLLPAIAVTTVGMASAVGLAGLAVRQITVRK